MKQYIDLVNTILEQGNHKPNRTGIDTLSYFFYPFRHDLKDGFPLLTTKKMSERLWNSVVTELIWFISGENHIREFSEHSKIWNAWADEEGDLETAYGFYWRHFPHVSGSIYGGEMFLYSEEEDCDNFNYKGETVRPVGNFDQLKFCVEQLKTNPNSRRLVVSAWEPYNAHKSKLPPCHLMYIFNVQDGRLCLHLTQRSCDVGLGVPFNISSYALLIHLVAQEVGLEPGTLGISFIDAHIYYADENDDQIVNGQPRSFYDHSRVLKEQIKRDPLPLPKIEIPNKSIFDLTFDDAKDFKLIDYQSHGLLKMEVAV